MITDNTEAPPDEPVEKKKKHPRAEAIAVARELVAELKPFCERLIVAGSLRRRQMSVGDVEIMFVPILVRAPKNDFFAQPAMCDAVAARLDYLIESRGLIARRVNREGNEMWGSKNKFGVHLASGIAVDFFATTEAAWWNYLVCRTGPAELNVAICQAAERKGWKWNPYREGFTDSDGKMFPMGSEKQVFEFAGLKYLEPWER